MKIAIICHFSNKIVQEKIKPWKKVKEFAPWINFYIDEFKQYPEHEIHIISPHDWMYKDKTIKDGNINFYFFRRGIPIIGRHWPAFFDFDFLTKYWFNKRKVRKYINRLQPDVINLIGAENPYYSSTILQFVNRYPILLSIQGFFGRGQIGNSLGSKKQYRLKLENEIIRSIKHQFVRTEDMWKYLKQINSEAIAHRGSFPVPYGKISISSLKKEYDFVFFARVCKDKGIYDYLEAIEAIKKIKPKVKAMIIGPTSKKMKDCIQDFLKSRSLEENIELIGFVPTQQEMFAKVQLAKISVSPTYNDLISGTIIESMFMELPVVTYRTGSIPEVNQDRENIIICEQGNKTELHKAMLRVLDDAGLQARLSKNGKDWVSRRFDNEKAMKGYFEALKNVKAHDLNDWSKC